MRIINQCLVRSMSSYQVSNTVRHLTRACGIAGLLAIFIVTTTVFPTQTADAAESGTPSQHSILISLYNDTAGGSWTNNNGWQGAAGTECSWYGVQCNGEGQVTGLNLNNNNLTGVLPGYLGQLSELNGLGLFDNNLSGTIPTELGQLSNLNYMDLGDNQLTGLIPVELALLGNLTSLYLYNNQLSGSIPDALGQLSNLTILNLNDNQLTGQIPQSILDLNLTQLSLYGNPLEISAGQRAALIALYNATGGANWTNNTGWLGEPGTECSWYGVQCNAGYVSALHLVANNLVGTLPVALKDLIRLGNLSLGQNQLSGSIPAEYGELANLGHLGLWANQLSGAIPGSLGNITNLDWISLGGNQLSGSIPAELGNLVGLRGLSLNHNQLSGAIPESLGNLVDLEQVDLQDNQLTGPIPTSIGNLGNLQQLRLNRNLLTGAIPAELATLENLQVLHLNNNLLTGAVPDGLLSNNELDLNIWANTGLDLALGSDAACDVQTTLELNGAELEGSLTPYQDCFIQERMEMVDFLQLELTEAVTVLRLEANSQHYWPRLGVLGAEAKILVADQFDNNNLAIEAILPAGIYVPYVTGGTYNHEYNGNVPATGDYSISASTVAEPQVGCSRATSVVKGIELTAALSSEDCLDTFNNANRLFDSYTIWLQQGESVLVTLEAEIDTQLLSFNENSFISATNFTAAGTQQGLSVTALADGWHRFSPYTTTNNASETGAYTISFQEPVQYGDPQACTAPATPLGLGQSVTDATLDQSSDCLVAGRLQDRYAFSLSVDTLFRATLATQGFDPLMSVFTADGRGLIAGSRAVVGNTLTVEYYLTAGDYVLQASSRIAETGLPPRSGSYQLTLTDALAANQIQGECGNGTTLTIPGAVINGALTSADCTNETDGITYSVDSYWLQLLPGQIVYPSLVADYPVAISYWYNGVFQRSYNADAGERLDLSLNQSGSHILYVAGRSDLELGDYELTMALSQPEIETIPIAFSYTFNSFSNVVDGVSQTGVSDHVLEGIVDAVMVDDDVFEVIALREASLDGNAYTIGETPGIVAVRANQPALMSFSGNVLDVLICPNGFSSEADCPFGAEGGFLISNFWPLTGPSAGQSGALAGHPTLGAAYRDRTIPIIPGNWSAALVSDSVSPRDVLIALYNTTGGANWINNTGWLGAEGTECTWHGIGCENNQVVQIDLKNNNLTGSLPTELGSLTTLRFIDIGGNQVGGEIPASLGNLSNLVGLWAWSNQLTGDIPSELGNLSALQFLNLHRNNLGGSIPPSLGDLTSLTELDLSYNLLNGQIPAELANLSSATQINLRNNQLSGDVPALLLNSGVVNLWGNINLNLAKGSPEACVADLQNPLNLNGTTNGVLTPFSDCHVADVNAMVDFHLIDLSDAEGTTLLRIDSDAQYFHPHLGLLGGDGMDDRVVMETQVRQPPYSVELALAPGQYMLYIHGGEYKHDRDVGVPATGDYSLTVSSINELQASCRDFNSTWVTKGVEINGTISDTDCLDTYNDPDRLFDTYAIWLEQGESVLVTLEADIATQLLSFNPDGFIAGSPFTAAGTRHGLTVTATLSGWHRFAPYTSNNNPTETGAYTLRFSEPPTFGNPEACTNVPDNETEISLGTSVNNALDAESDCFSANRLFDRYTLDIDEPTLFRAEVQTDGFMPLLGLYTANNTELLLASRAGIDNTTSVEFLLTPGQYWLSVTSRMTILDEAIEGSYTLTLGAALTLDQVQTGGCSAGDTRLVISGSTTVSGQINQNDCPDTSEFGEQSNNPERDGYQLVLPAGTLPLEVNLASEFNSRLSVWRNGQFVAQTTATTGQPASLILSEGGTYQINVLGQQGSGNGGTADRGNYTLSINSEGVSATSEIIPIAFSYTFSSSRNSGQAGVSDHVLSGIVDAVLLPDGDSFEVRGLREASLGGVAYTSDNMPGIVATRPNQPPVMSLSGNLLDVLICPDGFTVGNDCPFGIEGGFLISDFWPHTGSQAGLGAAQAGHPQFGASYRDRDMPMNKAQWSAYVVPDQACSPVATISLGQQDIAGTLNIDSDCRATQDRLSDRYLLELDEPTVFSVTANSPDFMPLTGFYAEGSDTLVAVRGSGAATSMGTFYLGAGRYWLFVSSLETSLDSPAQGDYSFSLSEALTPAEHICNVATLVDRSVTVQGAIAANNCGMEFAPGRYIHQYAVWLEAGERLYATLNAEFPYAVFSATGNTTQSAAFGAAGQAGQVELYSAVNASVLVTVRSEVADDVGNYTLSFSSERPQSIISVEDRQALEALYNSTGGANWNSSAGWLGLRGTECNWFGVSCDNGQVVAINLPNNNLTGSMPDVFGPSVTIDVSNNPVSAPAATQNIYLVGESTLFKNALNNVSIFYNVSNGAHALTGLGIRVHFSSGDIDSITFANTLLASKVADDSVAALDTQDHDNNPATDRFITIAWADINGQWPGALPVRLFDLEIQLKESLAASDSVAIGFSRTSGAAGYGVNLPTLSFNVVEDTIDVDGDGKVEALSDALLILRWRFGFSGDALIDRAISPDATRTDAIAVAARLQQIESLLDVDGNGEVDALTDGLTIMRYLFGFRGPVLINNTIGSGATRTNAEQIEAYLSALGNG